MSLRNLSTLILAVCCIGLAVLHLRTVETNDSKSSLDLTPVSLDNSNPPSDDYYDLGNFHYEVTTDVPVAQTWFDRGLAMCIAFNHEEGVRCFQKAIQADPKMPMAYWGMAYAMGPNQNNMETEDHVIAQAAGILQIAQLHAANGSAKEMGLIEALANRYPTPVPAVEDRGPANAAYAEAMRKLFLANQDDATVRALFAESLINLQPWQHWSKEGKPAQHTAEIVNVLEAGMEASPEHPALGHLYIHVIEASPNPERALPAAERLGNSMPGAGHLIHMPSHIYVLMGDYERTIQSNLKAIEADKEFLRREGPMNFYTLYRIHNYHFVTYGAMFDGQYEVAIKAARAIGDQIPEQMLAAQIDFLDAFMPMPLHVMVRFGRWEKILEEPKPKDFLPMSTSIWHYARAIAYAATGQVEKAELEQTAFMEAKSKVPETSFLFNNASRDILSVAEAMVEGEIEYRKGNFDVAFKKLRDAVKLDDALNYDEPWGWMQPARHALGALLLEQKRFDEAEQVYREDLDRHPNNPWSLNGLADCLQNQGKMDEASDVRAQFKTASQRADVVIDRSCFCKLNQ